MKHFYDRASMAHALTLELDPALRALLDDRFRSLTVGEHDLTNWTEYLVVEAGDTESDIERHVGFSPLVEPIDRARFGDTDFYPHWAWLAEHDGWFELIQTFGSTFAYVLFIQDVDGVLPELRCLCRKHSR